MVTEFEALEELTLAVEDINLGDYAGAKKRITVLRDKYKSMCEEFDKWADQQSEISENQQYQYYP